MKIVLCLDQLGYKLMEVVLIWQELLRIETIGHPFITINMWF